MKVLLISDSHGNKANLKKILNEEKNYDAVIFCGDGENDFPQDLSIPVYKVRGNNDFGSALPMVDTISLGDKKFMFTHGHTFYVKRDLEDLIFSARQANSDFVIFGHTHVPYKNYDDGLYVINPGSCDVFCQYATVDIKDNGTLVNLLKI